MNNAPRHNNTDQNNDKGTHKRPKIISTTLTEHDSFQRHDQILGNNEILDGPVVHKDQTRVK